MRTDIIVKESEIHGKGVFANKDFRKGEAVIEYNLKDLTKEEFEDLSEKEKHYTSKKDDGYVLFLSPERYVNHSCDSNTNSIADCDVAVRDIKKGEEITGDYSMENIPGLHMKCNCGSKYCRGVVT